MNRSKTTSNCFTFMLACTCVYVCADVRAQSEGESAKQLVNPFTNVVRVPLQFSYDRNIGPLNEGKAASLTIQPLIPFAINSDWSVISRTILPVVTQQNIFPGAGSQFGLGDTLQSFFLSPRRTNARGSDWGLGAALLLPTATNDLLGAKKWALGPTGAVFRESEPWTIGLISNHIWSVAASSSSGAISSTFLQPVLSYAAANDWSYTLQTESTYDWKAGQWSLPLQGSVAKLTKIGNQQVNLEAGVRYWAASPDSGPKGWGFSFTVTLLFPYK